MTAAAKVWPMDEGGAAVKTPGGVEEGKRLYVEWVGSEQGDMFGEDAEQVGKHAARMRYREGWYRWLPCSENSCYDHGRHRPGHIKYEDGPGRGVWHGVMVDTP